MNELLTREKEKPVTAPQTGQALFAGGVAAILASTCCLGPLVLVMLGVSGAWIGNLTVLEPYRPIFIGAALVALFFAYRRDLPDGASMQARRGLRPSASQRDV